MLRSIVAALVLGALPACATDGQTAGLGVLALSGMPGHELEQIYYVGIFDPLEQLPPSLYRIRLHGQASGFSQMRFASGWVPAPLIDSLNSNVSFGEGGKIETSGEEANGFETGRRLVLFGPEGFRKSPAGHRLVVVMGATPEEFFGAIDSTLATVSKTKIDQLNANERRVLDEMQGEIATERERMADLAEDVAFSLGL